MIALLSGTVAYKFPDHVILDVHGVGYRVHIPFSTYYDLPEEGGTVSLHVYTHVKEDGINLYGFRTAEEKGIFQLLISVSGIGPKLANGILSNTDADELAYAISRGDLARLSKIPGIGKKTAERLVVELREKMQKKVSEAPEKGAPPPQAFGVTDDVMSALLNLGYKEQVVQKALASIAVEPGDTVEKVLKLALKQLSKIG